ncbi:MAG: DUF503 domain-containing protein [Planctomycetota bacterium]|nr:DUF503 domain-containing protein [Planctomycetota bacterium]
MATKVALLHMELMIPDAMSLKDKRRIVKGFKDRIAHRWNVSISEVDHVGSIRQVVLAVAMVGSDGRYMRGAMDKIVDTAKANRSLVLLDYEIEIL